MTAIGLPKQIVLQDYTVITLRPMVPEDKDGVLAFFRRLPVDDRQYLEDDVSRAEIVEGAGDSEQVLPILAECEGDVVGYATLHRKAFGRVRHVGEIWVATDVYFRRRGLASAIAREVYHLALQLGLDKMVAEMTADQIAAIRIFEKLGFQQEARLANHVVDLRGRKHDLIVMTTDVPVLMRKMEETFLQLAGSVDG